MAAPNGDGEHEKMHVENAFLQAFPNFLGGKKRAGQIAAGQTAKTLPRAGTTNAASKPKHTARDGEDELPFPFVDVVVVVGNLHFARRDFGKRECRASARISARSDR